MFSGYRTFLAIAAGLLFGAGPVLGFIWWVDVLIERYGQEDVDLPARRTITLAESRVGRAIAAVDDLAARDVDSCRPGHLDALRRATFATTPVKELSIIGADGQTLCNHLNITLGARTVLTSQPIEDGLYLDVVKIAGRAEHLARIRRVLPGGSSIGAAIPAELFIPQVATRGGFFEAHARMTTTDGTLLAEAGRALADVANEDAFTRTMASQRYGLVATMTRPRELTSEREKDLKALRIVVPVGIAIVLLFTAMVTPFRVRENPVAELERAINRGEFIPFYQPIVDIASGRLYGAEVLVRWRKPDGTLLLPGNFIALAESSGLITEMTRALMRTVCAELGMAYHKRPSLRVSFNLTAKHLADERIVADLKEIFGGSQLRLTQVVLELTERHQLQDLTTARRVIAAIQGSGAKVAIDDVGAGHSGLSYLLKLGVDVIKIDKMFVDALGHDSNSSTIIETLVELGRNLRMDIIAEGVENFEQVTALRQRGIRAAQGYVFAPPLPGSAFLQLVDAIDPQRDSAASGERQSDQGLRAFAA